MKSRLVIIALAAASLLLSACGGPQSSAEKFARLMQEGKSLEAQQYCTQSTQQLLSLVGNPFKPGDKFIVTRKGVAGNTARVYYRTRADGGESHLDLINVDGKWLVDVRK